MEARAHLVAQAALVWGTFTGEDLRDFIECGELPDEGGGDVLPYDPQVAALIAQNWES
jgi:hypothetical protein